MNPYAASPTDIAQAVPADLIASEGVTVLWIFFWFGVVITAGFAFGLIYHWLRFGYMYPLSFLAIPTYSVGVLVLVGAMLTGVASL